MFGAISILGSTCLDLRNHCLEPLACARAPADVPPREYCRARRHPGWRRPAPTPISQASRAQPGASQGPHLGHPSRCGKASAVQCRTLARMSRCLRHVARVRSVLVGLGHQAGAHFPRQWLRKLCITMSHIWPAVSISGSFEARSCMPIKRCAPYGYREIQRPSGGNCYPISRYNQ